MKKILLGTTTLIGATALMAGVALAEDPKVSVGGFANFEAGFVSDDLDAAQRSYGFRNDTEVSIRVDGRTDGGLGYGGVIDLEADVTADADGEGLNASRTYLYLEGSMGRVEMGSNQGAAEILRVDASSVARATGGIDGAWTYWANISPAAGGFITTPSLPIAHGATTVLGSETTDNNNKITYYSPRFSGFQVGASYAPDMTDRGQTVTRIDTTAGSVGDIIDLALNYEGQWDEIGFAAAATGTWGDGEAAGTEDLGAYNVGAVVSFSGFSLAGSWGDWDDSLTAVGAGVEGDYFTLGGAYDFGPFGVSVTYLDSEIEFAGGTDNEFDNLVFGADYALAPGLTPYAEVSVYDFDAPGTASDNDGTAFILGTELAF